MPRSERTRPVRIHLVGHAHLDPVWLWDWREGLREALATFRSAVDLMGEHPDYKFAASSAAFYEWVRRLDPRLLQQIRRQVGNGRWEAVGGWWVEADENLPGGEGLIRQGIYGQRLFEELFGARVKVAFNPDAFGHPSSLPRILNALGQKAFVFMRPGESEKALPSPVFRWRASDGSEVLAVRVRSYNATAQDVERKIAAASQEARVSGLPLALVLYGIGDHGGGPNRELLRVLDGLRGSGEAELVYSTLGEFLRAVETGVEEFPVVEDELRHHAVGCYSVDRGTKLRNRRAEHALLALERWQAVNWLAHGVRPDARALEDAWRTVLFNQFHDILAGTSIRSASEDAHRALDGVLDYADRQMEFVLRRLASEISVPWPEGGFVVFNPWPWTVRAPIEFEYAHSPGAEPLFLETPRGQKLPLQSVRRSDVTGLPRSRWVTVDEIPALGYRVYRLSEGSSGKAKSAAQLRVTGSALENGSLRLDLDPETGAWRGLFSRPEGENLVAGPACVPAALRDRSDTWSHGVESYEGKERPLRFVGLRVEEGGPVRVALRVDWRLGCSQLSVTNRLYRDLPGVFVDVTVDWQTPRSILRLSFPLDLEGPVSLAEEPYGVVQREATGAEVPCQQWLAVEGRLPGTDRRRGLLVINDGLWSYSLKDGLLRLTLLRSPVYAHHEPSKLRRDMPYDYVDLGRHRFRFWLIPYSGDLDSLAPFRLASVFNLAPRLVKVPAQAGKGPEVGSWLRVEPENVLVTVVKKGFHRSELVLRCLETAGRRTRVSVRSDLLGWSGAFDLGPWELKTVGVRWRDGKPSFRTLTALEDP